MPEAMSTSNLVTLPISCQELDRGFLPPPTFNQRKTHLIAHHYRVNYHTNDHGTGGGFFHSKGTWGCAAHKGIHFWTSSLAKGILCGNFSRV